MTALLATAALVMAVAGALVIAALPAAAYHRDHARHAASCPAAPGHSRGAVRHSEPLAPLPVLPFTPQFPSAARGLWQPRVAGYVRHVHDWMTDPADRDYQTCIGCGIAILQLPGRQLA